VYKLCRVYIERSEDLLNKIKIFASELKKNLSVYVEKHFGKNLVGKKCYKVLHERQDKPCSFCTNDRLIVEGRPGPPVVWDFQDSKTRLWEHSQFFVKL
jgi:hypothetical protein